jgi:RNA polymerase primary sigma factor
MDVPFDSGESGEDPENGSPSLHEDGLVRYLREVERSRLLTRSEEKVLLERARAGDRQALNDVVTANLKWVVAVSGEFRDRGLPMSDLIAEGNLGLIRAALNFDPSQGFRFSGFAIWWIRQGLEKALTEQVRFPYPSPGPTGPRMTSWAGRLSPEIRQALGSLAEPGRTVLKLFFGLGTPDPMPLEAISRVLGIDLERAEQLKEQALRQLQKTLPEAKASGYRDPRPAFHP